MIARETRKSSVPCPFTPPSTLSFPEPFAILLLFHYILTLDPRPKRSKYPHGYPGDAPRLIHRTCHYCSYAFPPIPRVPGSGNRNVDANGEPIECTNCGHIQCMECPIELPNHYHVPPSPVVETSGRSRVAQDGPIAAGISGS